MMLSQLPRATYATVKHLLECKLLVLSKWIFLAYNSFELLTILLIMISSIIMGSLPHLEKRKHVLFAPQDLHITFCKAVF